MNTYSVEIYGTAYGTDATAVMERIIDEILKHPTLLSDLNHYGTPEILVSDLDGTSYRTKAEGTIQ